MFENSCTLKDAVENCPTFRSSAATYVTVQVKWATSQPYDVKFFEDVMYQKSSILADSWPSHSKNKRSQLYNDIV